MNTIRCNAPQATGEVVYFNAKVVKDRGDGTYTVRVPDRVRALPFPPMGRPEHSKLGHKFIIVRPTKWQQLAAAIKEDYDASTAQACEHCKGTGKVGTDRGNVSYQMFTCPVCNGSAQQRAVKP